MEDAAAALICVVRRICGKETTNAYVVVALVCGDVDDPESTTEKENDCGDTAAAL